MSDEQIRTVVDGIFDVIESKEGPMAKAITEIVRKTVDANLPEIIALIRSKIGVG